MNSCISSIKGVRGALMYVENGVWLCSMLASFTKGKMPTLDDCKALISPKVAKPRKALPTVVTTSELDALLAQFPRSAVIARYETAVTVRAPNGDKVLSAIGARGLWSVRAVPGLINPV